MEWEEAKDVREDIAEILKVLKFPHIKSSRIFCFRTNGSKSRSYARIWAMPKIFQKALGIEPAYIIEVLSRFYDGKDEDARKSILIHEILHIPKNFSGALVPHIRHGKGNFYTKVNLLELLLEQDATMTKVLVFTATKKLADQLFESLEKRFEGTIGIIHSNKEQNHRFNTVKQFKEGTYRFIIATDIVARGIDISEVTHVINFDTPDVPENYIHRIGRTGRFDKKGIAISFTTEKEMPFIVAIEELMKYEIPVVELPIHLSISDILTEDEKPKVYMKVPYIKPKKKSDAGPAFHEKSAKNQKRNVKVKRKDEMKKKYGKPIKRGAKK